MLTDEMTACMATTSVAWSIYKVILLCKCETRTAIPMNPGPEPCQKQEQDSWWDSSIQISNFQGAQRKRTWMMSVTQSMTNVSVYIVLSSTMMWKHWQSHTEASSTLLSRSQSLSDGKILVIVNRVTPVWTRFHGAVRVGDSSQWQQQSDLDSRDFTRLKRAGSLKDDCASPRGMTKFWSTGSHQIGLISISRRTSEVSKTKLRAYRWPEHS